LRKVPAEGLIAAYAKVLESHVAAAQGNTQKAISAIAAAERVAHDRPVVNWMVGCMYVHLGQLGRAEEVLRAAIAIDPSFEQAHALLARVLSVRGKAAEAAEAALHGLSIDYSSASMHSALGIALSQSGDDEGALKAFETSLAFDPQLSEAAVWTAELTNRERKSA
jgi:tetratricopeptide (TPR) repeat protein